MDAAGNLFIADTDNHSIRRVTPDGIITTVAGNGESGFSGDGGPATSVRLSRPCGVAVDRAGNLFIADALNNRIRKVARSGIITTVAQLAQPTGLAVDGASNLFIAHNGAIRKLSPDGVITTVAGTGVSCSGPDDCHPLGDGGPATSAALGSIPGIAVDDGSNLFFTDLNHQRIRKVSSGGIITTVAGTGAGGFLGDGGPAASAQLNRAIGVAVDSQGNLFIADYLNQRVRKVAPGGLITTVAGNGTSPSSFSGDGGPANSAQLNLPRAGPSPQ